MRALPVRRTAASALCAMLLLGVAAPAVAADHDPAHGDRARTVRAPAPEAAALLAQTAALGDVAGVLKPVTELLSATLEAEKGQLPAADAAKLSEAVKQAIAKAAATTPNAPQTPADPQAPAAPQTPAVPQTPAAGPAGRGPGGGGTPAWCTRVGT
ncbi:hypothetical protein [Streptomyces apricus]|uniref:Secreted protein n=1 Tax=Streptomyces apricus TaxID=1828112 RepID=A0A5A9ZY60_9ACTN|nr:hypothetical protein [Streptomyces apricus]KAA0921876.1 hypothetical protein FGF04_35380 [Streptomyces apricus]